MLVFLFALSSCQQAKENVKSQDVPKTTEPIVQAEDGYIFNVPSGQVWDLKDGSDLFISFVDQTGLTDKDREAKNFYLDNYSGRVQMLAGKFKKISDTSYKLTTKDKLKFNLANMKFSVIFDTEDTRARLNDVKQSKNDTRDRGSFAADGRNCDIKDGKFSFVELRKCNYGSCYYGIECMWSPPKCSLGPNCTWSCARCGLAMMQVA